MIGGIIVIVLTGIIAFAIIGWLKQLYPFIDDKLLKKLFFFHLLLSFAYYGYVLFNPSDSLAYYFKVLNNFRGDQWFDYYGTSTTFIEFIGYPFIQYLGFSYEAIMALFSFFGFLGYIFFYLFCKEQIKFKHTLFNKDLLTLIFFLPNLHFWSSSFGKGSIIFLGIALYFFGISKIKNRISAIVIGALVIYHVRPHIMFIVLVSSMIGFVFSTRGVSTIWKVVFLLGATIAFFFIYRDVLTLVGIDEEEFITQGLDLSHRAGELTKATSGVDISNYSLPMQVFTFLYRPLFFDAPGILGLIVSFENLFYVYLTLKFLNLGSFRFVITSNFLVKSAFLSFVTISIALAQIAGNLGLAMRQKSQVMILFMFVIISFLDEEKYKQWKVWKSRQMAKAKSDVK
jgi:hypothetical protein